MLAKTPETFASLATRWQSESRAFNQSSPANDKAANRVANRTFRATEALLLKSTIESSEDYTAALDLIEADMKERLGEELEDAPINGGALQERTALRLIQALRAASPPVAVQSTWTRNISDIEDDICEIEDRAILLHDAITSVSKGGNLAADPQRWDAYCRLVGDLLRLGVHLKKWFYEEAEG